VLINFGHGVLAADALRSDQPDDQRVLWPKEYAELLDAAEPRQSRIQPEATTNVWGQQQIEITGRRVQALGPAEYDGVVYLQGNNLYCVDPLRGQSLWQRHDLASSALVWGDDQVVLVAPADGDDSRRARVFRFLDGQELESCNVPPRQRIWSTLGRMVLTWDERRSGKETFWRLRLFDPWTQQDVWQHEFPADSRGELTADGELAIVTPQDRLHVLDARTGETLLEQQLEPSDRPLLSVYWRSSTDQSLLVRSFEPRATSGTVVESFPDQITCPLIDGDVYAFSRPGGQPLWSVPAVIEGYGLPLDQPDDVPVLAFVRQVERTKSRSQRPSLSLLCIDKRDGRILLDANGLNFAYGSFFMSGDPAEQSVSLRLLNVHNYQLTFTDDPQPPEPPAQTGSAASRRKGAGILNIFGAAFYGIGRHIQDGNSEGEEPAAEQAAPQQPGNRDPFLPPER
jgi:outer membrane protein assembly factor BamB